MLIPFSGAQATLGARAIHGAESSAQAVDEHRGSAGDAEQLRYVVVNGVKLAYRMKGAGVPVIFVHGEGYSHELWKEQLEPFAQKYFVIAYDRRGHGQSEAPFSGYSPIAHAEDLNGLMKYFGIEAAHFVVNSRGGRIILQFLRLYPEKVRSVVFADAAIALTEQSPVFRKIVEQRLNEPVPTLEVALKWREEAKKTSFTKVAQATPETRAVLERMLDQYSPRVAMNPQKSDSTSAMDVRTWNQRDYPDMAKLYQPMLLIVGELSDDLFINAAKEAHKLWPNSRYAMIPDVDHLLALEAPEKFNTLALNFLADVDATIAGRNKWIGSRP